MEIVGELIPVVLLPFLFTGGLALVARFGGWSELAERYQCNKDFTGKWKTCSYAQFSDWASYKGCISLAASSEGLYLKTYPSVLFRPFHPPLLIPWTAIKSVEESRRLWKSLLTLRLNSTSVTIKLDRDSILEDAQRYIPDKLESGGDKLIT